MTRYLVAAAFVAVALLTATLLRPDEAQPRTEIPAVAHIQRDTGSRAEGIALIKQAIQEHNEKKYAEAIASYDRAAEKLPQIADWLAVFAASSASFTGDTAEVERRLASADKTLAQFAWRSRVRAFAEAGAPERALALARTATNTEVASTRAAAWSYVLELEPSPTAQERAAAGRAFLRMGETTRGVSELLTAATSGDLPLAERANIRYEVGRVLFAGGKYDEAISHLERVPDDHGHAAEARFLLARSHYRDGRADAGLQAFRSVVERYPKSQAATRAQFFLADIAHDAGELTTAARHFEKAAAAPTKTTQSSLARMRLGGMAFVQGEYVKAARIFEQYRKDYPDGDYHNQATYWAAQSALRGGNAAVADKLFADLRTHSPVSYYGMLARDLKGAPPLAQDIPAGPQTDTSTVRAVADRIDRWRLLHEVGWNEASAIELGRVKGHFAGNTGALYLLAEHLNNYGAPHLSIATGRELLAAGGNWNIRLFKIMYPLPYKDLIERESRAHGLDPYFVAALIRQESRFNTNAKSGAGAIGLMQVMPATGRQLQHAAGVGPVDAVTLTQAETNIKLGTRFLADVLRTYDNRVDLALIAYNAGPTRATRWRSFPEFKVEDLFIERIPFDETRDYVKVVKLNAAIYRALYQAPPASD